jgi:NAD(P)-dependent dehydrogenase (short-subunit alcohol dehydrogenase family)
MASALIVGVGPGLSAALARRAAGEGLSVALVARRPQPARSIAESLPTKAVALQGDAGDAASLEAALRSAIDAVGVPELVVYNAGRLVAGTPDAVGPQDLLDALRVDVVGAFQTAQLLKQVMIDAGGGTMVLTGGGLALTPTAALATLSVGKAALRALALVLAESYEPLGLHVATVTIAGRIGAGNGPFDPDDIAGRYWELHRQPRGHWTTEVVLDGNG